MNKWLAGVAMTATVLFSMNMAMAEIYNGMFKNKKMCDGITHQGNNYTFFTEADQIGCADTDKYGKKTKWYEYTHSNRSEYSIYLPSKAQNYEFTADVEIDGDAGYRTAFFQVHINQKGPCYQGKCVKIRNEKDSAYGIGSPPSFLALMKDPNGDGDCYRFNDRKFKCFAPRKDKFKLRVTIEQNNRFDRGKVRYYIDGKLVRTQRIKNPMNRAFKLQFGIYRIAAEESITVKYNNVIFKVVD